MPPYLSIFKNCKEMIPDPTPMALEDLVDLVRSDALKHKIERIRELDLLGDEEGIKALKESLPCITPSGIAEGRGEEGLKHYSHVVCADFDDLENPEEIRPKLQSDPNVSALYLSPSGKGLKAFIRGNAERKWHKMAYRALSDHFKEKIGVGADFKAADISHLCFLSYDPDAYYNPNAETFQVPESYLVESPEVSLPVEGQQQVCTELDTPEQEAAAVAFLKNHHKLCKDKEHRQSEDDPSGEYLLEVFNQVGDFGISPEKSSALVKEHYNSRCEPPWDFDNPKHASHWEEKLRNSYRYRVYPLGCCSPEVKNLEAVEDFKAAPLPPAPVAVPTHANCEPLRAKSLGDLVCDTGNDPEELLKYRFLSRRGAAVINGPTGIGKSSWILQAAILWALGLPCFGIPPSRQLISLIVQAENDDGDLVEMREGIFNGLRLTEEEKALVRARVFIYSDNIKTGKKLVDEVLRPLLKEHQPDLLWLDNLFAYAGCSVSDQEKMTEFLRTLINPLIHEFPCGCLIAHHTNKPPSGSNQKQDWSVSEAAYLGSGTSEIANWARAILTIRATDKEGIFELIAAKRGGRLGWKDETGAKTCRRPIAHSTDGNIYWREPSREEIESKEVSKAKASKLDIQRLIEVGEEIPKEALVSKANGLMGIKKAEGFISQLINDCIFRKVDKPRSGTRPEVYLERVQ